MLKMVDPVEKVPVGLQLTYIYFTGKGAIAYAQWYNIVTQPQQSVARHDCLPQVPGGLTAQKNLAE